MLFNSFVFLMFAVVVFALHAALPRRFRNTFLLLSSYVFYGSWDARFLSLLLFSTLVDFAVGKRLGETQNTSLRKRLLGISLVCNLGVLAFFKYFNFFLSSAEELLRAVGLDSALPHLSIILPVGISFYTFQTLSYTIDVYRRQLKPTDSLIDFALYISFFPQLVAGPIERATHLLPQLQFERRVSREQLRSGSWLIFWGLFKKMVIADNLALYVDQVYSNPSGATGFQTILATYAFAYQIYCDFSGYTDIARGLAKLLGIELMLNFNRPYLATSPSDFWRRWHISLSTWLRDYLYIPLGGNRFGFLLTYRNLLITMILGGLWHGANSTFILWGLFHGVILCVYRVANADAWGDKSRAIQFLKLVVMFHLTCFGWMLFRANSLAELWQLVRNIFGNIGFFESVSTMIFPVCFFVCLLWIVETWTKSQDDPHNFAGFRNGFFTLMISLLLVLMIWFSAPTGVRFIYFQF